ncbi:hypothetical protein CPB86DRAFT_787575 [Serendipita vermifera]|nr:hypothetical protein CPB86DRAFT_787575 [Serendipita vermifera]
MASSYRLVNISALGKKKGISATISSTAPLAGHKRKRGQQIATINEEDSSSSDDEKSVTGIITDDENLPEITIQGEDNRIWTWNSIVKRRQQYKAACDGHQPGHKLREDALKKLIMLERIEGALRTEYMNQGRFIPGEEPKSKKITASTKTNKKSKKAKPNKADGDMDIPDLSEHGSDIVVEEVVEDIPIKVMKPPKLPKATVPKQKKAQQVIPIPADELGDSSSSLSEPESPRAKKGRPTKAQKGEADQAPTKRGNAKSNRGKNKSGMGVKAYSTRAAANKSRKGSISTLKETELSDTPP